MTAGLFKYFPTDADKLERFTNGQIFLTPPKYFNDPWDFRLRSEPRPEEQIKNEISSFLQPPEVAALLNDVNSPRSLEDEAHEQQGGLSKLIGVVSLTEKPLNRLMWAHYGESHHGFVAEFRHGEEGDLVAGSRSCMSPFGGARKVQYRLEQPLLKGDKSNLLDVCWTKHVFWTYEQEWRVVESLKKADRHPSREGYFLLWFKPANLIRVILGLRVSQKVKFHLGQMLNHKEYEHVRREEVYIDPESRELNSRPLSW